ncbi:hypothetical protein RIF29_26984 [Crotalaria pallida]|uniref:RNase H type-1 domain-containing protein n=1 Tax=Crotalaria pallida TaxID=3830 RepID=A0AAN9ENU4_CROPI
MIDASLRAGVGTGAAFIALEPTGHFMAAGAKLLHEVAEPRLAEAATLWWTLEKLDELGISHVRLLSDCEQLVLAWSSNKRNNSYFHGLIQDSKEMTPLFHKLIVKHVGRDKNKMADQLARIAFDVNDITWLDSVPTSLVHFFRNDACYVNLNSLFE